MIHRQAIRRGMLLLSLMALTASVLGGDGIRVEAEGLPAPLHRAGASPSEPI